MNVIAMIAALRAQCAVLRAQADALDKLANVLEVGQTAPATTEQPPYVSRKAAKRMGIETRVFNAAGRELGFLKPGRELLLPTVALVEWIERRRVRASVAAAPEDESAPLPIDACRFLQRRRAG